jgi:hypothetical protein
MPKNEKLLECYAAQLSPLNERDQAWFLLGTRRSDAAQYLGSSMAMANSGGSSSRPLPQSFFLCQPFLICFLYAGRARIASRGLAVRPGETARTSYQAASASLAFLVVADEGDARINIPTLDAWAWKLTLLPLRINSSPIFRKVLTAERMPQP